ncbi:lysoplasmalogenase [Pseudomonas sp. TUM22785]|uniref:lysoplasmalogenase n=1 Tax=Pseudomonas sp. TUM22785 TaxID=3019098 RepID=UPI002306864D|nr:lysoplasmalogenase [Pseudomonas sp. TUM22785]WCD78925.1 lysoplasmalogenase [Pseudomonas sp. TUM22785]
MQWLLIGLIGAVAYLYGDAADLDTLCFWTKPVPILALLAWLLQSAPPGRYRRWVALGLLLCLAGDVLLQWSPDFFVFGLGAFLLGHLAYIGAYLADTRRLAPLALLAAALFGIGMFAVLASGGLGDLLVPVALYALTISTMLWRALARLGASEPGRRSVQVAAAGALCFVVSDSLLGVNRFVAPFEMAGLAIMLTYWLGQLGIVASAVLHGRR